ncbi:MAG: ABC transporter permease [Acidobacteria bacterium]|nr:ABC transporter permease [Acidobacteriota bacterium]
MLQHLKFGWRLLRKNLGFTIIAVSTLGLGIGATTAVFTLVDTVLLRPLAYREPAQLVSIAANEPGAGGANVGFNPLELDDLRQNAGIFDQVAAVWPVSANVTGGDHPERIELLGTSPNYFSMLGVAPELGRVFGPEDEAQGFADAVVLSDAAWHRLFGGDRSVLGRRVYVDTDGYTVVGIMPPGFRHPGNTVAGDVDIWATAGYKADPFPHPPKREQRFIPSAMARLKPGISLDTAQKRLDTFVSQLRQQYPDVYSSSSGWRLDLTAMDEIVVGKSRPLLWTLLAAVAVILFIGCINIANLLLARATTREREIGVRLALGASRSDLILQLLTESFLISVLSTLLGITLGWALLRTMIALASSKLPRVHEISLNLDLLFFVIAIAMLTTVAFGLVPALQTSSPNLLQSLGGGGRAGSAGRRQNKMREGLVIAEVAMSLVLLAGAGLLGRTLWRLVNVDPGFNPSHVEIAQIWLSVPNHPELDPYGKPEQRMAFNRELLRRLNAIPFVQEAALSGVLPLTGEQFIAKLGIEGRVTDPRSAPDLPQLTVSPNYFHALQTPLLRGRLFAESDDIKSADVAIIDQTAARQFWGNEDPIGHRVAFLRGAKPRWFTIVGVVANLKQSRLDDVPAPHFYFSLYQVGPRTLGVIARLRSGLSQDEAAALASTGEQIKRQVQAVDKDLPVFGIQPMTNLVTNSVAARRFAAEIIGTFSIVALLLAAIGVYGVISYWVTQRTRELGIRMAIGAQPGDVLRLVLKHGLRLCGIGIALGLAAAAATSPLLRSQVYGVSIFDPVVLSLAPMVLLCVAFVAAYRPASRAMKINPIAALREE